MRAFLALESFSKAFLATLDYADLEYLKLPVIDKENVQTREELISQVLGHWEQEFV